MENKKYTSFELDQLKEVINIGASYASTALSQLINKQVTITVPEAMVENSEEGTNNIPSITDDDKIVTAVVLKILGDIPGVMGFFMPQKSARVLANLMTDEKKSDDILNEYDRSTLKEVGNILSGSALSALSKFMNVTLLQSVSEVVTDMQGAIINTLLVEVGKDSDLAMVFKVNLMVEGDKFESQLCLFTNPESSKKMLDILKSKLGG